MRGNTLDQLCGMFHSMRVLLVSAFLCVTLAGLSSAQEFRVSVSVSPFTETVLRTKWDFDLGFCDEQ